MVWVSGLSLVQFFCFVFTPTSVGPFFFPCLLSCPDPRRYEEMVFAPGRGQPGSPFFEKLRRLGFSQSQVKKEPRRLF